MTRYRTPAPAIPFIFLHGTDAFNVTTTPTALTWAHAHNKTSDFGFVEGKTRVYVNRGNEGVYKFYASCGAFKATGNPTELVITVYINGVQCECATAHGSVGAGTEHGDATIVFARELKCGDYVEIFISTDNGTVTTEEETARLIIEGLPMKGWDNNHGGKLQLRGGIER